jgi:hypothetical protein
MKEKKFGRAALITAVVLAAFSFVLTACPSPGGSTGDRTAPTVGTAEISSITQTTAAATFTSDEAGTYYYLVLPSTQKAPDASAITDASSGIFGTDDAIEGSNSVTLRGLTANTAYKFYAIVVDAAENISNVAASEPFTTLQQGDTTAPTVGTPVITDITQTTVTATFTSNEAGNYYYLVLPAAQTAPDAAAITGASSGIHGTAAAINGSNPVSISGLAADTSYKFYVVVKDASNNTSPVASSEQFTTLQEGVISYTAQQAGGSSGTADSTAISLAFSENVTLVDSNVTVGGVASKNGSVAGSGTSWSIPITVTSEGTATVSISQSGIDSATHNVSVYKEDEQQDDTTAPTVGTPVISGITQTTAMATFTSNEAGNYYYLVLPSAQTAPDAAAITGASSGIHGTAAAINGNNSVSISGLDAETSYKFYVVVKDASNNTSLVAGSEQFTTLQEGQQGDTTAPTVGAPVISDITQTTATATFTSNEAGTYYYLVLPTAQATPDGSAITGATEGIYGTTAAISGSNQVSITGLTAETSYKFYVVVQDASNNISGVGSSALFTTLEEEVINAVSPVITLQPVGAQYEEYASANNLTVSATVSDDGILSYEWYKNDMNSTEDAEFISSGSENSIGVSTYPVGITYYYCVVTNTITDNGDGGTKTASVTSNIVAITVVPESGNAAITIGFDYGEITITGDTSSNIVSKTGASSKPTSITFTVSSAYTNVKWYIDGDISNPVATDNEFVLEAEDYSVQLHSLTFVGTAGGISLSKIIPFAVIE